jgi:hypothetical protein
MDWHTNFRAVGRRSNGTDDSCNKAVAVRQLQKETIGVETIETIGVACPDHGKTNQELSHLCGYIEFALYHDDLTKEEYNDLLTLERRFLAAL